MLISFGDQLALSFNDDAMGVVKEGVKSYDAVLHALGAEDLAEDADDGSIWTDTRRGCSQEEGR